VRSIAAAVLLLTAAFCALLAASRWSDGKVNPDSTVQSSTSALIRNSALLAGVVAICVVAAVGLVRRHRWAHLGAAAVAVVLGAGQFVWTVHTVQSTNQKTDSGAYAGMGSLMFLGFFLFLAGALVWTQLHAARAPAGWYGDPDGSRRWRYWDGAAWTGHVAPRDVP
jgi:uncharacterized BrkB/YihY/UPF0761 family membrane protein